MRRDVNLNMTKYFSKRYQRHKRIKRILSLKEGYEAYRPSRSREGGFLFPRYTWIRFFITLVLMIVIAGPLSQAFNILFSLMGTKMKSIILTPLMMAVGFFIVEIVDEFFLDWERTFDRFIRTIVPIAAIFAIILVFMAIKSPQTFIEPFMQWRQSVNDNLQSKAILVTATPASGLNWQLIYEKPGALRPMNLTEAISACKSFGGEWRLYDGDHNFVAKPAVVFSRSFHVWMNTHGAQIETTGIAPPKAFVMKNGDSKFPVLCINKKVKI